jgi:glycosyltransferase involved in cell wall biosynthesis
LEYFVLDGGSRDGSREIIEKYSPWLAGWRCEQDRGQAAAVNEGWAKATGDWVAWINSDDWYQPGGVVPMIEAAERDSGVRWISGFVDDHSEDGVFVKRHPARSMTLPELLGRHRYGFHQPAMFWKRTLITTTGPLDEKLHHGFCPEFWARLLIAGNTMAALEIPVACFRRHTLSKTGGNYTRVMADDRTVWGRFSSHLRPEEKAQANDWLSAYEADRWLVAVYQKLAAGKRGEAASLLLKYLRLIPKIKPPSLFVGALIRVLITGKPAAWFLNAD